MNENSILIIDDDPASLNFLSALLRKSGYKTMVSTNGKDGVDCAVLTEPDLILLDVFMPEIDGFETCRLLKNEVQTADIPVIFMTALSDIDQKIRAFDMGAADYIVKPFNYAEVLGRIKSQLTILGHKEELKKLNRELVEANRALEREVAERRKAAEQLKKSEERYRELFDNMNCGAAVFEARDGGREFVFRDFNRMSERIEKIDRENLIGKSVTEVFPGVVDFGLLDVFKKVWRSGQSEHHPVAHYMDDRVAGWRENFIYKLSSGEIVAFYTDETERIQALEELKRTRDEMEEQVLERTRELEKANEQLRSLSKELFLTEERERHLIATDLHDSIGQSQALIKIKLAALRNSKDEKNGLLDEISDLLEKTIHQTRSLTFEISPPVLYKFGLSAAIEWLVEKIDNDSEITVEFINEANPRLDDNSAVLLYRAVRELMMNSVKHAHARNMCATIRNNERNVVITIQDDGVGFDACEIGSKMRTNCCGFGLFSVGERLSHLGGNFRIESKPGMGTLVTLTAPLKMD